MNNQSAIKLFWKSFCFIECPDSWTSSCFHWTSDHQRSCLLWESWWVNLYESRALSIIFCTYKTLSQMEQFCTWNWFWRLTLATQKSLCRALQQSWIHELLKGGCNLPEEPANIWICELKTLNISGNPEDSLDNLEHVNFKNGICPRNLIQFENWQRYQICEV